MKTYMIPATKILSISGNMVICGTSATPAPKTVEFKGGNNLLNNQVGL